MPRPPRVVFVDHVARLSGAEIALARLVEALGDRVDAHVVLGEDGPLIVPLRGAGATVTVLPLDPRAGDLRRGSVRPGALGVGAAAASGAYVRRLAGLLRRLRPDRVHTVSLKAALYGGAAGRLARIPVVWHLHDRITTEDLPASAVRLVRSMARSVPSAVLANSATTLATVPGARRGRVVPNPVPAPPATAPVPDGALHRVAVVGRLAPWKGQDVFLRAFAEAFPTPSPVQGELVGAALFGEDDYAAALRLLVDDLGLAGRVELDGFVADVGARLARSDVLVHCSTMPEPFGQVVVEGMAAGLPVVAADAGGPAEVVTHEVDGLLVPPGDVAALAGALRRLDADPALRRRLAAAGLERATDFHPEVGAAAVLAAYADLGVSAAQTR